MQLAVKFGELPPSVIERIYMLTVEQLEDLAVSLLKAVSLKEVGLTDE